MLVQELEATKKTLSATMYENAKNKITDKSCLCVGLANASYLENEMQIKGQAQGVVICPGPNMAYFDKEVSLQEMTQHIYGTGTILTKSDRPNMFVKELHIYIEFLKNKLNDIKEVMSKKEEKYMLTFANNLDEGILYYQNLFMNFVNTFEEIKQTVLTELELGTLALKNIRFEIESLSLIPVEN